MDVFIGIFSQAVPEYMLSNGGACHTVEVGSGGMSEQVRMEVFIDAAGVCRTTEYVL